MDHRLRRRNRPLPPSWSKKFPELWKTLNPWLAWIFDTWSEHFWRAAKSTMLRGRRKTGHMHTPIFTGFQRPSRRISVSESVFLTACWSEENVQPPNDNDRFFPQWRRRYWRAKVSKMCIHFSANISVHIHKGILARYWARDSVEGLNERKPFALDERLAKTCNIFPSNRGSNNYIYALPNIGTLRYY